MSARRSSSVPARETRARDERGSITVLALGFAGVLLAAIAVVVDVSAVLLAQRGIAAAADGAAAAAAQQVDRAALATAGLQDGIPLDAAAVQDAVAGYQVDMQAGQPGLVLSVRVDGPTATVTARRTVRLPLLGWSGVDPDVPVTAETTVRSPVVP